MRVAMLVLLLAAGPVLNIAEAQAQEEGREVFEETRRLLESGNDELGVIALQEFLQHFPSSPLVPQAEVRLGELFEKKGDRDRAIAAFERAITLSRDPFVTAEARERLAGSAWKKGETARALSTTLEALMAEPATQRRGRLHHLLVEIYRAKRDPLQAITHAMDERALVSERGPVEAIIREIVDAGLPDPIANAVVEAYPRAFPSDYVLWRLIDAYQKQAMPHMEEKTLRRFLADFPDHQESRKARQALSTLKEQLTSPRFRLGALLPLTGPLRDYGQRVLNGIRIAAEGSDRAIGIIVRDTEGTPARLEEAFEELHREYGVIGFIGPLLSREVELLSKQTQRLGLPLVTPSAVGASLPAADHYIFRTAMTTVQQGTAIADYAVRSLGLRRFTILHPDDVYGLELASVFTQEVTRRGGEVIASESYAPHETDFGRAIKHLRALDLQRLGSMLPKSVLRATEEYVPGFDAVFLPGDADRVMLIAAQLAFYDVRHVILLGTGGWTAEGLRRVGGRFFEGSIVVDGFFAQSRDPVVQAFVARYKARFQENPDLFAAQAYDATRLVIEAIGRGATTGQEIHDALLRVQDYHGVSGLTSMTPTGEADKRPFVLRVQNGQFIQVETP